MDVEVFDFEQRIAVGSERGRTPVFAVGVRPRCRDELIHPPEALLIE
jgi:hypothetical protein